MDTHQAAAYLGVHPSALHRWRREGRGPAWVRLGDGPRPRVRYRAEDLVAYVAGQAVAPGAVG
jgi:predicted site-specific integrase-resolvase